VLKRHFLLILKILYVCLKSLDTVSVSESPTQIFCIGNSLDINMERGQDIRCYKCGYVMPLHQSTTHQCYLAAHNMGAPTMVPVRDGLSPALVSGIHVPGIPENHFSMAMPFNLTHHMKSAHEKKRDFKCDQCEYAASSKCNLTHHIKSVHKKERHFKCDQCDYAASVKCNLTHHIQSVHGKKRDFKCHLCDYAASVKCNLTSHIRSVHEKKRDFKCNQCDYAATVKCNLTSHIKSVHEKKRDFKCGKCDYATSMKCNLTQHMKIVH